MENSLIWNKFLSNIEPVLKDHISSAQPHLDRRLGHEEILPTTTLKLLLSGKPFVENYKWESERGTRFWFISQDDGEIVDISEGEACFAFHHVNAFEQGVKRIIASLTDNSQRYAI